MVRIATRHLVTLSACCSTTTYYGIDTDLVVGKLFTVVVCAGFLHFRLVSRSTAQSSTFMTYVDLVLLLLLLPHVQDIKNFFILLT